MKNMHAFHDAEIVNVFVDRKNSIVNLELTLEDVTSCSIKLYGVRAFRCEDLIMQNVVSRILQSAEGQFSSNDLDQWINWITSLSDASSWLAEQRKQEWLSALSEGKINLIVFEPSAGATLAAICEGVVENV